MNFNFGHHDSKIRRKKVISVVQFIRSKVPARIDDIADYLGKAGTNSDCSTHLFCNESALAIMKQRGSREEAALIKPFMARINEGVLWADGGYRNITHFFNPLTRRGLWNLPSAAASFRQAVRQAMKYRQKANVAKAMFYVGAAAHLLQDICVPHHSCNLLFSGHAEYEHWVEANLDDYPLIPDQERPVSDENFMNMFLKNALISSEYADFVTDRAGEKDYRTATGILLPLAQYSTAKLLVWIAKNLLWTSRSSTADSSTLAL